ncbi:hypothetical protein KIW84_023258 [Lathyrus oleraceus]|uniref:DUF7745 domain-containing protein n=1 Tax=Pisum sativum TaxID=3888 RepID=A0A9D4YCI1_PEA|nr:hypothetical protein KIW84_023258 [Pisum sativum]
MTMDYGRRNTKKYSFRCPDLKELRKLASFVLDPLDFKQHFQLVPTLEEYSYLLGIPVSSRVPFSGLEEIPRSSIITEALQLKKSEIEAHRVKKGGLFWLPSVFLIREATTFAQVVSVDAFEAIFVLLIYVLALFPNIDGFVDVNAIRLFLIGNPVPTVPSSRTSLLPERSYNANNSLIFLLLRTRLLLLLQASKSSKVEHPIDCVVTSFNPKPRSWSNYVLL